MHCHFTMMIGLSINGSIIYLSFSVKHQTSWNFPKIWFPSSSLFWNYSPGSRQWLSTAKMISSYLPLLPWIFSRVGHLSLKTLSSILCCWNPLVLPSSLTTPPWTSVTSWLLNGNVPQHSVLIPLFFTYTFSLVNAIKSYLMTFVTSRHSWYLPPF